MRKAVYKFREYGFNREYTEYDTLVEIVGETTSSYKIKLLQGGPKKQTPGTELWVRKKNVKETLKLN